MFRGTGAGCAGAACGAGAVVGAAAGAVVGFAAGAVVGAAAGAVVGAAAGAAGGAGAAGAHATASAAVPPKTAARRKSLRLTIRSGRAMSIEPTSPAMHAG
ncbi:MAG: hypothetical protein E6I75_16525 [Chloroflexi bacterium]|nr:MAG: hypothetical protein E6I75_16525 [Chloroflexota bacterium]